MIGSPRFFLFALLIFFGTQSSVLGQAEESADTLVTSAGRVRAFYPLPIISAAPETSLRLGAVGVFLFRKEGQHPETQLSSIRLPISYTLNNQFKAQIDISYYSNHNRNVFSAQAQWFNFPLLFWGIGNSTPDSLEEQYTTQTTNVQLSYLRKIKGNFFAGVVYDFYNSAISETAEGGLLEQPDLIVGAKGGKTSGFGLRMRYDTRDNNLNAADGIYLDFRLSTYQFWAGSDFSYTQLRFDARKYFQPFKKHVLATQIFLVDTWGDPSFENLALLGGKTIMRGHYEGRYRDNTHYAAQMEYRLPLKRKEWIDGRKTLSFLERLGVVGFLALGDVAHSFSEIELSKIKYSAGFGIRYLILPEERINVRLDFGFGTQFPGVYFNIREAF